MTVRPELVALSTSISSPVLVLGATSLVGGYLLQELVRAEVDAVAVSRTPRTDESRIRWIRSEMLGSALQSRDRLRTAFCALPISLLPRLLPVIAQAGIERLIALSSTSRYTKIASAQGREREQAALLGEAEHETQATCESRDISWTILRPTLTYAEGHDRNVTRMARFIERFGILPLAGRGMGLRQPVHAQDLAIGALQAALSPATRNRAYNLPGGETLSYRTMCERVFEGLGKRPKLISVPPGLWAVMATVLGSVMTGVSPAIGTRMSEDLTFDGAPAERDFGWHPRGFHPRFEMTVGAGLT